MAVSDIKMLWHNPCHNYDGEGEMNQKTASRKTEITREEEKRSYEIV